MFILHQLILVTEERNKLKFDLDDRTNITSFTSNVTENSTSSYDLSGPSNEQRIVVGEMMIFIHTGLLALVEIVSQFLISWASSLNIRLVKAILLLVMPKYFFHLIYFELFRTACRLRSACLAVSYKKLLRSSLRCSTGAQQVVIILMKL